LPAGFFENLNDVVILENVIFVRRLWKICNEAGEAGDRRAPFPLVAHAAILPTQNAFLKSGLRRAIQLSLSSEHWAEVTNGPADPGAGFFDE
jgi:hypothetical protein